MFFQGLLQVQFELLEKVRKVPLATKIIIITGYGE